MSIVEKYAFTKIFRVPYNSVSHNEQFSLHQLGLLELKSAAALCSASKVRYLHSHRDLISTMFHRLFGSCDHIPLSDFSNFSRSFWDSPAICATIFKANSVPYGAGDDAGELETAINSAITEIQRFRPNGKIQGAVYNIIRDRFHACNLIHTMQRRCSKYFSIDAHSIFSANVLNCKCARRSGWVLHF